MSVPVPVRVCQPCILYIKFCGLPSLWGLSLFQVSCWVPSSADGFDVSGRHYTPYHVRSASSVILCQAALDFDWCQYPIIFFLNFTSCPKCYVGCPARSFVCVQRWVQVNDYGVDGIVMCRTLKLILYICETLLKDKFNFVARFSKFPWLPVVFSISHWSGLNGLVNAFVENSEKQ